MKCVPVKYSEEFCLQCDAVKPFINGESCIGCSSANPFGEWYDDDITDEIWEDYLTKNIKILS